MAISISDLPPKYQAQAVKKYMEQQARRGTVPSAAAVQDPEKVNKYRNTPTTRVTASGAVIKFASQKEARRYDFLIEREQRGEIQDLRLQVDFTLQEAYTDTEGRRVRAIRYRADFTYYEGDPAEKVVEDVKSRATRTKDYAMKKKLLKDRLGIDITEV
ncbi:DUF1064 domain-containing protein [Flavonifractor sp. An100]|uniref:DUF1064 domain-containing protein n=1 Tax=Flavonifractor sp. An100 TaxID=1965538 RepID=UPI000B3912AC|nr:DUF1064 domain-containing protein [Flavonifractor sp. An100]OUQ78747.1 hypothetical protein B5E43_07415 [Flavonifractor sp. An100]